MSKTGAQVSLEITPPPKVTQLYAGDSVDFTVDYIVLPQLGNQYHGYNAMMKKGLAAADSAHLKLSSTSSRLTTHVSILRDEALLNVVDVRNFTEGSLVSPAAVQPVRIMVHKRTQGAWFTVDGGYGYVPFVFEGIHTLTPNFRLEWHKGQDLAPVNKGGSGCTPSKPCQRCQADCDKDSDCATGLKCFQRTTASAKVPGCAATGYYRSSAGTDYDYCYNPVDPQSWTAPVDVFQVNFDEDTQLYRRTYNIPMDMRSQPRHIRFRFVWDDCPETTTATSTLTSTPTSSATSTPSTSATTSPTTSGTTTQTSSPTTSPSTSATATETTTPTTTDIRTCFIRAPAHVPCFVAFAMMVVRCQCVMYRDV